MAQHASRRGFTLIELLIVMTIIATLASLAIVGVPAYLRQKNKLACESQLKDIYKHLMIYEMDRKAMPTASGGAFVLSIWGNPMDKSVRNAQTFFCPSTARQPTEDLSNVTPEGIDFTGPDQHSQRAGRNALTSHMAGASEVVIISNKCPDPQQMTSEDERRKNLPHAGKGIMVLYLNGATEFIDAERFADNLPVVGPESSIEKLRWLVSGFDG